MSALRVLTVDDEPLALRRLQLVLRELPEVEHVGSASGCTAAVTMTRSLQPDVLLLDIQMRDGSGFDVVDRLDDAVMPAIIFVTAFDAYAAQAFDVEADDYVLKPVELDRLRTALERARRKLEAREALDRVSELRAVVNNLREQMRIGSRPRAEQELWIRRNGGGSVRIAVDDIQYFVAEDDYVSVHANGRDFLMRETVGGLHARLDEKQFIRVHRSCVVKASEVVEFRRKANGSLVAVLRNGTDHKVGRVYAKRLRQRLPVS